MIIYPGTAEVQFTDTVVTVDKLLFGVYLDAVSWYFSDIQGWSGGASVRTSFTDRPSQHGSFDGPVYRGARVITIPGTAVADDPASAEAACDALTSAIADGSMGSLTVANSRRAQMAKVRMSDHPQVSWVGDSAFLYQLQFTAPDYRKYGAEQTAITSLPGGGTGMTWPLGSFFDFGSTGSLGQVVLENNGTADTEPVVTISGPMALGFQVTQVETGRRLRYPAAVGDSVILDCSEGTATAGGQDRTGVLTSRDWFTIPASGTSTLQFSTLGGETATDPARMSVTFSPAYH